MGKTYLKTKKAAIDYNADVHNKVAQKYDELHVEIFNPTEQARIEEAVQRAFNSIDTRATKLKLLDFGAGTGNLTMHLWRLGAEIVAADVSEESLRRLREKIEDTTRLSTIVLNGEDLSNFSNNTFDMVATYSTLHHIPDYIKIIEEFVRVVKPGGVVYLDHEASPSYWSMNDAYNNYLRELGKNFLNAHLYELGMATTQTKSMFRNFTSYAARSIFSLFGIRRNTNEFVDCGDIHVFKHDHIQWDEIALKFASCFDTVAEEDYLVCRERTTRPLVWERWRAKCDDMRLMIVRKRFS